MYVYMSILHMLLVQYDGARQSKDAPGALSATGILTQLLPEDEVLANGERSQVQGLCTMLYVHILIYIYIYIWLCATQGWPKGTLGTA